ncbi:restriction endonuclease subunit S, partial [Ferroacidibacillus organovorans]
RYSMQPLNDIIDTFIDYRGKTPNKVPSGVPLITAKVVKGGRIETPLEFISMDDYETWMRRGIPRYGDVVLTTEAPLGEVAQIQTRERIALAQRIITLRGQSEVLDNTFLRYALQYGPVQAELHGRASGTTVQGIKSSELKKVNIPVPDLTIQERIADILCSLDDKIELNRRMNETLEQMAMALYKHSFADDTDGGSVQLEHLVEINPRMSVKKGDIIPFVDMKALSTMSCSIMDEDIAMKEYSSGMKFLNADTLFARITPCLENGKTAFVDFLQDDQTGFGSTEFLVLRANERTCPEYVYCTARWSTFREHAVRSMVGTSGRQRVQTDALLQFELPEPDADRMKEFHSITSEWFALIRSNTFENSHLNRLREYLLPRLLSGEIELVEVQEQVEEVV